MIYVTDGDGAITSALSPDALQPIKLPENTIFGLHSYYQAIENTFPNFAKHLALRGVLKFSTLKKVLAHKDAAELSHVWSTVLGTNNITKYALQKMQGTAVPNNFYDRYLERIDVIDAETNQLLEEIQNASKKIKTTPALLTENIDSSELKARLTINLLFGLIGVLLGLGLVILFQKKRKRAKAHYVINPFIFLKIFHAFRHFLHFSKKHTYQFALYRYSISFLGAKRA